MKLWCALLLFAATALPVLPAESERHVQFIIDDSISMRDSDPNGVARLSARLFYDLMELKTGESFTIRALTGPGKQLKNAADLDQFLGHIDNTEGVTNYIPVLSSAAAELNASPSSSGKATRKVIVFVTDGKPEDRVNGPGSQIDYAGIRQLCQRFSADGISFYLVVFGPDLSIVEPAIDRTFANLKAVTIFREKVGQDLLRPIATIFANAFGAIVDGPDKGLELLRLPAGTIEAYVITYHLDPKPPSVRFSRANGAAMSLQIEQGEEKNSSFSLHRMEHVVPGNYAMAAPAGSSTMVLRKVPYNLIPCDPKTNTVIETPFAHPAVFGGEDTEFCFVAAGYQAADIQVVPDVRRSDPTESLSDACPAPVRSLEPAGLVFKLHCRFPPADPASYKVTLAAIPERNGNTGNAVEQLFKVIPSVHLMADPDNARLEVNGKPGLLHRGETGCATFHFSLKPGASLPEGDTLQIGASLDREFESNPAFQGARASLDGVPLAVSGETGDWNAGHSFDRKGFAGIVHRFCITAGTVPSGSENLQAKVPLHFKLAQEPYDALDVIDGFTAFATVAPPTWYALWGTTICLVICLLTACVAAAKILPERYLPVTMVCRSWASAGGRERSSVTSLAPKVLRFITGDSRVLTLDNGSFTAGTVRATTPELFLFVARPDVDLVGASSAGLRSYHLQANESYELATPRGVYWFRIEYT